MDGASGERVEFALQDGRLTVRVAPQGDSAGLADDVYGLIEDHLAGGAVSVLIDKRGVARSGDPTAAQAIGARFGALLAAHGAPAAIVIDHDDHYESIAYAAATKAGAAVFLTELPGEARRWLAEREALLRN